MKSFDFIIFEGGYFGAVLAEHLWFRSSDEPILVLEAGPFLLSEHTQYQSMLGLGTRGSRKNNDSVF